MDIHEEIGSTSVSSSKLTLSRECLDNVLAPGRALPKHSPCTTQHVCQGHASVALLSICLLHPHRLALGFSEENSQLCTILRYEILG
jgi:hypothetical protein